MRSASAVHGLLQRSDDDATSKRTKEGRGLSSKNQGTPSTPTLTLKIGKLSKFP